MTKLRVRTHPLPASQRRSSGLRTMWATRALRRRAISLKGRGDEKGQKEVTGEEKRKEEVRRESRGERRMVNDREDQKEKEGEHKGRKWRRPQGMEEWSSVPLPGGAHV